MNDEELDRALISALGRGPRTPSVQRGAGSMIKLAAIRSRRRRSRAQATAAFAAVVVVAAGITIASQSTQRLAPPIKPPPAVTSSVATSAAPSTRSSSPGSTLSSSSTTGSAPESTTARVETFALGARVTFASPDGKIRCASGDLRGLLVHCQTDRVAASLPGPKPTCNDDPGTSSWGKDVALLPGSWAAFTCDADTLRAPTKKLTAGASLRIGDVSCTAKSASEIECRTPSVGKATGAAMVLRDGRPVSATPGNTFGKLDIDPTGRQFETGFLTRLDSNSLSFRPAYQYASRVGSDGYQLWWLPDMTAKEKSDRSFVDAEFFACCGLGLDGITSGTKEGSDDYGTLGRNAQDVIRQMLQGSTGSPVLIIQRRRGGEGMQYGVEQAIERFTTDQNTVAIRAVTGGK